MLAGFARQFNSLSWRKAGYRAGVHFGLVSLLLLAGAGSVHDAAAENETRTLSFHHTHSDEDLTITFKRDGRYDEEALKQLNHYLRDWRTQEQTVMDPHLFDILWEVYRDVDGKKPIQIISAYRSPTTNAMLRSRRSSGVARYSQHMLGHAMDFFIPGVPLEQIRYAGLRLQRGGVGFYPSSGSPFVHLDTGSIRHWPRMTRDQLAKVFPDGRTVHIPSDGVPMKGYELARADIERRDGDDHAMTRTSLSLWDRFFKGGRSHDDEDDVADTPAVIKVADMTPSRPAVAASARRARPRGMATLQLASADAQQVQAAMPKPDERASADNDATKPQTPEDIINARGFWGNIPGPAKQPTPEQIAAIKAREAANSAEPQSSASIAAAFQALAYMPAPGDHPPVVAASVPVPPGSHPASSDSETPATGSINSVVAKDQGQPGPDGTITTATRIAVAKGNDIWLRALMLAPSTSSSMFTTVLGDTDMTLMRSFFVKPQTTIAMSFSNDPQIGLPCDRFTGSATAKLATTSFAVQTAALH
ncbi:MAG TPA: DUF882 domain-containing protein [Bradyrhizobium sp.]|nr:DUF882 domain-containing protein [Bradyrhizobium sp.]